MLPWGNTAIGVDIYERNGLQSMFLPKYGIYTSATDVK